MVRGKIGASIDHHLLDKDAILCSNFKQFFLGKTARSGIKGDIKSAFKLNLTFLQNLQQKSKLNISLGYVVPINTYCSFRYKRGYKKCIQTQFNASAKLSAEIKAKHFSRLRCANKYLLLPEMVPNKW